MGHKFAKEWEGFTTFPSCHEASEATTFQDFYDHVPLSKL